MIELERFHSDVVFNTTMLQDDFFFETFVFIGVVRECVGVCTCVGRMGRRRGDFYGPGGYVS